MAALAEPTVTVAVLEPPVVPRNLWLTVVLFAPLAAGNVDGIGNSVVANVNNTGSSRLQNYVSSTGAGTALDDGGGGAVSIANRNIVLAGTSHALSPMWIVWVLPLATWAPADVYDLAGS